MATRSVPAGPSWLRAIAQRLTNWCHAAPRPTHELSADPQGFCLATARRKLDVPWSTVRKVEMFKRELAAGDLICVRIEHEQGGQRHALELNEDMPGYRQVLAQLGRIHPDLDQSWWSTIALPRCSTNTLVLWQASESVPGGAR